MHANRKQQKKEKSALNISLYGGLIFVFLEFFMSIYTHSQAVLLDAIYDGVELVMILLSIGLVPFLYKPSNEKHPYGYLQVESLFVVIKGFMMISVTIGLIVNNMEIALKGGRNISFTSIAVFELFATILSIFIISSLRKRNRKINSPLVRMEIQEWTIDVIASLGMSFAFFLPTLIHGSWFVALTPYLDQIVAIILSLFMLPTPIKSVITGLRDLFLLAPEEETLDSIKSLITPLLREYGYTDLYFDIVRTGRKLWISVYITFDKDLVSISTFTTLQNKIIASLQTEYQDFYFELLPDIKYTKSTS
ncbi:MAG: cation transporter [Acetivibrio sp.]